MASLERLLEYKHKNLTLIRERKKTFWQTMTPKVCGTYVEYLKKVISKVVGVNGGPTGFQSTCTIVLRLTTFDL